MKVALCCPTRDRPTQAFLESLKRSVPLLDSVCEHATVYELGCPYISGARCTMLGKALRWGADKIVFLDDDVSWRPEDLVAIITAEGDVVGGTYRFKCEEERYMGKPFVGERGHPMVRSTDGAVQMLAMPAGFLRVTRDLVERMWERFPWLRIRADDGIKNLDLFNHGAYQGVWFGEDYAFCRRCVEMEVDVWCLPDMDVDHNGRDEVFRGNYHRYLSTYKPERKAA